MPKGVICHKIDMVAVALPLFTLSPNRYDWRDIEVTKHGIPTIVTILVKHA